MKLTLYILAFILMPNMIFSQQKNITLEQCRDSAKVNWPGFKKNVLQKENVELIKSTLNKNYLPKLTLSSSATYQSEVVVFPEIPTPGFQGFFPTFPNDNYRADIQLQQIIYDGGNTKNAKTLQLAANKLEETQDEIENYNLMEQINQLYLNIILLKQNINILNTAGSEIADNLKILKSAYNNGAVLISEVNKLTAAQLLIDKQILDTKTSRLNLIKTLQVLTGIQIDEDTFFRLPKGNKNNPTIIPQLKLFGFQGTINQASLEMEHIKKFPKLSLFANGGYGRPGYNFMNTDLHTYAMIGVNISWNIFDWGTYAKQQQKAAVKQNVINVNKDIFIKQNNLEINKITNDIGNINNQIELDTKIIIIKEDIKNLSWSKFKNGTITSNEYLKDFNDLKVAKQTLEINKIKLIQKRINLNHLKGELY